MRVMIRGMTFESVAEAAVANKVTKNTIYAAISKGTPDSIGLRRGTRPPESHKSGRGIPIKFAGIEFPSMSAASVALGFRPKHLRETLKTGKAEAKTRIVMAAMRYNAKRENAKLKELAA